MKFHMTFSMKHFLNISCKISELMMSLPHLFQIFCIIFFSFFFFFFAQTYRYPHIKIYQSKDYFAFILCG